MTDVKSKNLYELLGNDHDQDSDKEPEPPVKTVDKPAGRIGKRDAPKEAPGAATAAAGGPRRDASDRTGGFNAENRKFRERTNGRGLYPTENRNRDNPIEGADGQVRGRDSGPGTQRGGRGRGGPRRGGDRHSRTGRGDHQKQVDHGWGAQTGEGEETIEKAGEADAQADKKEENTENATVPDEPIPEPEPEPEDTSISYAQYLEQQAQKKLEGLGLKEARAANEGAKDNKKWKNATALSKEEEEEAYFIGEQKAKRERERASKKQLIDIDYAFKEQPRESRGGRGGAPRGRGRGDRGDRGERGERGERGDRGDRGEGRGEFRGGRGRGDYGARGDRAPRGDRPSRGRGQTEQQPAIADSEAFPALGGK